MRTQITGLGFAAAILAAATAANAQMPVPDMKTYASSSDVTALIAKAKADLKPGRSLSSEPIVAVPPYRVSLEYRPGPAAPVAHQTEAELIYVIDGSATFVYGGKMPDEKQTNPTNSAGTTIDGGTTVHLAKGDFVFVPENTPHWFKAIDGTALIDMSLHMPGAPTH